MLEQKKSKQKQKSTVSLLFQQSQMIQELTQEEQNNSTLSNIETSLQNLVKLQIKDRFQAYQDNKKHLNKEVFQESFSKKISNAVNYFSDSKVKKVESGIQMQFSTNQATKIVCKQCLCCKKWLSSKVSRLKVQFQQLKQLYHTLKQKIDEQLNHYMLQFQKQMLKQQKELLLKEQAYYFFAKQITEKRRMERKLQKSSNSKQETSSPKLSKKLSLCDDLQAPRRSFNLKDHIPSYQPHLQQNLNENHHIPNTNLRKTHSLLALINQRSPKITDPETINSQSPKNQTAQPRRQIQNLRQKISNLKAKLNQQLKLIY